VANAPVTIEKHKPERRRKEIITLYGFGGGCHGSCCCCCCLHTLGSIIGAAVAPAVGKGSPLPLTYYLDEETGEPVPNIRKPGASAVKVFWRLLIGLTILGCAIGTLRLGGDPGGLGTHMFISAAILLMAFPAVQLVAAFITLIVFSTWVRPDRPRQLKQLGKITAGVVLGTILGIVVMVAIGAMLGAFH
jgi:hypothetical protein